MNEFDLDPEILAFIDCYVEAYSGAVGNGLEQQRDNFDAMVDQFRYPHPQGVTTHDSEVSGRHGSIPVRYYRYKEGNNSARIVFLHGGGYILGSLESHDDICAELCATTTLDLVSIGYRLSPEYFHPVPLDDVEDAVRACWHADSILLGVSAGANLAAALCHRMRASERKLSGQVLVYPGLGGECLDLESYQTRAEAPLLNVEDIRYYRGARCETGEAPEDDPEFYPLLADDFSDTPPTIAISADIDPLRDDSRVYVEKLVQAGVQAEWSNETGLVHDFLRARHISEKAGAAFSRICDSITRLANKTTEK